MEKAIKYILITSILIVLFGCNKKYQVLKKTEGFVMYKKNKNHKPTKRKLFDRNIEYRPYDVQLKLIEVGEFGEDLSKVDYFLNQLESSLEGQSYNTVDDCKVRTLEKQFYDEQNRLIESKRWRCVDNKPLFLNSGVTYNYGIDSMAYCSYKDNGAIRSQSTVYL